MKKTKRILIAKCIFIMFVTPVIITDLVKIHIAANSVNERANECSLVELKQGK